MMNDLISDVMNAVAKRAAEEAVGPMGEGDFDQPWDILPEWNPEGPLFQAGDEVVADQESTPAIPI